MTKKYEINYLFGYIYDKSKLIVTYPIGANIIEESEYEKEVEVAFLEDGIEAAFEEEDIKLANDIIKPLDMFLMKPSKVVPLVESIKDYDTKENLTKVLNEFNEEYEVEQGYLNKGYVIKDYVEVFKNVVDFIPKENLDNLNILKIEKDNFDMNKFIEDIKNNLDEEMDTEIIPIMMEKSNLTPRLFVKSNKEVNSFYVPFAIKSSLGEDSILCADKTVLKNENLDLGDLEISATKDAGYIIEDIDNVLNFKISNFNSKTENNNQITQVVDYAGKIKPSMIEFLKSYVKTV